MNRFLLVFLLHFSVNGFAQDASWFTDVTSEVGLDNATSFRLYVVDLNSDDYPDIAVIRGTAGSAARDPIRIYLNIQDSASSNSTDRLFFDITEGSGVNSNYNPADTGHQATLLAFADVDNDGDVDMVTGNYYHRIEQYNDIGDRCEVLLNDGSGKFSVKENNGLHDLGLINPTGFSFLDYNKDGNIDLFIAPWFYDYTKNIWNHGFLMKGNGDGTFIDVSLSSGIASEEEPMYGSAAVDWNNDGWPDIATSPYCRTGGQLWKNKGDDTFENVAEEMGYDVQYMQGDNGQNLCMWGSMPEDFDDDGDMDFIFSLTHGGNDPNEGRSTIVVNEGADNDYKLHWELDRLTWDFPKSPHHGDYDASWFDMDNDGYQDIVLTQGYYAPTTDRIYLFRQNENRYFDDVTGELSLINAKTRSIHAVEVFDFDLDGDDDILYTDFESPRPLYLLRNDIGNKNNWLAVKLIAPDGVNKSAIGSRIFVYSDGKVKMREVYAGRGNVAGQQPFTLLFGLGQSATIDSVLVQWPDNNQSVSVVKNPDMNQTLTIGSEKPSVSAGNIYVYPNPTKDNLFIQLSTSNSKIELFDIMGNLVNSFDALSSSTILSTINLLPGYYFLRSISSSGEVSKGAFVKLK